MFELEPGFWIDTRFHGEAVVVKVEGERVYYRYSAIPHRNGKPQVLNQVWPLQSDTLSSVTFKYPTNVVSAAVLELEGTWGDGIEQNPEATQAYA